jgi:PAS domain S-box-containing protein
MANADSSATSAIFRRTSPQENSGNYADSVRERAPGHAASTKRARIVLADDNADMRDYVGSLLARDYEVVAVSDGQAALESIQAEAPSLVLTDVMMPRLDGFGLVAAIRADERTRSLPVIVLSARAGEEARIEGLGAGADDYLIKPFSARELLARVASQLALAAERQALEQALRYGREQLAILLDAAPIGIYLIGSDFRIRSVNAIARRGFGDVSGTIEGRDFDEVVHQMRENSYADEIVRIFRHTLATGEPYLKHQHAVVRPGRDVEYFEWRLERITLPDGERGLVCYFRDISAHVAAGEQRELCRQRARASAGARGKH